MLQQKRSPVVTHPRQSRIATLPTTAVRFVVITARAERARARAQLWAHARKQRVKVALSLGRLVSRRHAPSGLKPAGSSSRWALMNPVSASNSRVGPSATICPWSITRARGHSSRA